MPVNPAVILAMSLLVRRFQAARHNLTLSIFATKLCHQKGNNKGD